MKIDFEALGLHKGMKVVVAMSGGVDSSVTAMLAKEAGCDVTGVTLKMFESENNPFEDAAKMAEFIGIPWHLADYSEQFGQDIITYFIREYKFGHTPNPCSRCNRIAKTKYMFDQMQRWGAERILTGHYAQTEIVNGARHIKKALHADKDQSYYLALMEPFHAELVAFPLGGIPKTETRAIAAHYGLPVAEKPDSQEACFLMGRDYREYLEPFATNWRKGDFILEGKRIGKTKGIHNYTVGQRRGLEISHSEPLYVKKIDSAAGDVYLGTKKEVFTKGVALRDCSFFPSAKLMGRVAAKLRYRMNEEPCIMEQSTDGRCFLLFDKAQFAPAPGQTAAIYDGDIVIGGGVIDRTF